MYKKNIIRFVIITIKSCLQVIPLLIMNAYKVYCILVFVSDTAFELYFYSINSISFLDIT